MRERVDKFIPCDVAGCHLPVGRIADSSITIISRHHGEKHPKTITLDELLELLREQTDTKPLTPDSKGVLSCAEVVSDHL